MPNVTEAQVGPLVLQSKQAYCIEQEGLAHATTIEYISRINTLLCRF